MTGLSEGKIPWS